jgi:hypothetical protein
VLGTRIFLSNIYLSGIFHRRKYYCKEMESMSRLKMEKFNGTSFVLWKLKMEDIIVDKDLCVAIFGTKPIGMIDEEWVVLEIKTIILIKICLDNSLLLNNLNKKP